MSVQRRSALRSIMELAWSFKRAEPTRTLADCLKAAWAWTRRMNKEVRSFARRVKGAWWIHLSPSLIRSPATNRHGFGTWADRSAGRMISRVGR